jgi:hypothetical protein
MPRSQYLEWTGEWVSRAARAMAPDGSLFLNVGAKPTDPWTAIDVAQAARPHLQLQNTIHWIKSIAIEKALAGTNANLADDLAVGHYKPINSRRFLHDCHEFVFHFTNGGQTPIDRQAIGVRYQDRSNIARWQGAASGVRCRGNTWFIPYETIQSRAKDRPHRRVRPPFWSRRWSHVHLCLRRDASHQARDQRSGKSMGGRTHVGLYPEYRADHRRPRFDHRDGRGEPDLLVLIVGRCGRRRGAAPCAHVMSGTDELCDDFAAYQP